MENYFHRVQALTSTGFWINNVTHSQADLAIKEGAIGCTQNPSYVWKILNHSEDETEACNILKKIILQEKDDNETLVRLQRELVGGISKHFYPIWKASNGEKGYVSIQGNPLKEDADSIIKYARFNTSYAPNIMAKIPVTEEGLKTIEILVEEGVPINATECMSVHQVLDVCDIYEKALPKAKKPAPLYFSLITGIFDEYLQKYVSENKICISQDVLWQAGIAVAKKVHELIRERKYKAGFISGGARGLYHFTEMVGAKAVVTINWRGTADKLLEMNQPVVERFLQPTPYSVEDELVEKIPAFRKAYFINEIQPSEYEEFGPVVLFRNGFITAWNNALNYISDFRKTK